MLEFKVTLRLSSKGYTLEEIKKVVGEPTKGFSIGDEYAAGKRRREFTLWSLESSKSSQDDFESHLQEVLAFLETKYPDIQQLSNYEMDLFCMFSSDNGQGGALLTAVTMKKISSYNLNIVFDVYG